MPTDPMDRLKEIVTLSAAIIVGLLIVSQLAVVGYGVIGTIGDTSINPTVGQTTTLDENMDEVTQFEPTLTRGYGIELNSGDDYVNASEPANWDNNSWTACAVGELADGANLDATYSLLAIDNETVALQYDGGSWVAYYDNGTDEALAAVPAVDPQTLTPVCARHNESTGELTLNAEGNQTTVNVAGGKTRQSAINWRGAVDEYQLFDQRLTDSEVSQYQSEPAAGLGVEPDARWMFEEGSGDTTEPYFFDSVAELNGSASFTGDNGGVQSPDLARGSDYEVSANPLEITPLAGGLIDKSPILYITWGDGAAGTFAAVVGTISAVFGLIAILPVVIVAGGILIAVQRFRRL